MQPLIVPGIAILLISQKFFDSTLVLWSIAAVAPIVGLLAYYRRPRYWELRLGFLVTLMLFLIVISLADQGRLLLVSSRPLQFHWP